MFAVVRIGDLGAIRGDPWAVGVAATGVAMDGRFDADELGVSCGDVWVGVCMGERSGEFRSLLSCSKRSCSLSCRSWILFVSQSYSCKQKQGKVRKAGN